MKNCVMNNMASGSKELQLQHTTGKDMHSKNREVTFIILQKNMRFTHSSEKNRRIGNRTRRIQMGCNFIE